MNQDDLLELHNPAGTLLWPRSDATPDVARLLDLLADLPNFHTLCYLLEWNARGRCFRFTPTEFCHQVREAIDRNDSGQLLMLYRQAVRARERDQEAAHS